MIALILGWFTWATFTHIFWGVITVWAIYIFLNQVAYSIASGVYKARARYPHVIIQKHQHKFKGFSFEIPTISELRRRMMSEVEKKESSATQPPHDTAA